MDNSNDTEGSAVDIDLIYSGESNLETAIAGVVDRLTQRGYKVRSLDERTKPEKDARFRVYFFNKAFKSYQLPRYESMIFDKTVTTPDNSLVLCRNPHRKYLPDELSRMRLSVPLLEDLSSEDATKAILRFLVDREALGREQNIQAFDRQFKKIKEATNDFDRGRAFILISNVRRPVPRRADSVAMLPWLKVFDMSEKTDEKNGFLTAVKPRLTPGKFSISQMNEVHSKPESDYTSWTVWTGDYDAKVLFPYANLLGVYCCGLKVPTIVVLWYPQNNELDGEVRDLITRLTFPFEGDSGSTCILVTENVPTEGSPLDKLLQRDVRESNRVIVPLQIFLQWFAVEMRTRASAKLRSNLVPASKLDADQPATVALTERELNQLNHGMRLLTFDDGDENSKNLSDDVPGINFLQGDLISWETIEDGRFDADRQLCSQIVQYIENEHLKEGISGIVKIHHHPGSGGTTLARQVLWEMRKKVPCLAVEEGSENMENLREKIAFLRNLTHLPTILLMDGPIEAENILKVLPSERVLILHVARYYGSMENKKNENGDFYLKEIVSKNDACNIFPIYQRFGKHSCDELSPEKLSGQTYLFEYGLTAFTDNFRGIREYVKGHLREMDGGNNWRGVIELLALAKHYGNKRLPKQIFRIMLGKPANSIVKKQDIAYLGRQLIQGDGDYWSIRYVEVAREILKQTLMRDTLIGPVGGQMLELTGSACDNLKDMVFGLIETLHGCVSKPKDVPNRILEILRDVFIKRHEIGDEIDRYKKYSMLLADVDSDEHREEIFQKLVECFPKHADFHAHLGRFYSHIKRFEKAEAALQEALKVREEELAQYRTRYQEGDDTLSRIHHMLGTSYFERMQSLAGNHDSGEVTNIVVYANKAIEQFEQARRNFTAASNQTYGFLGEVKVRLEVVDFANKWGLLTGSNFNCEVGDFAAKSFGISDRLLAQCAERADDYDLKNSEFRILVKRILEIYGNLTPLLENFTKKSAGVSSCMCRLASLRNKYKMSGRTPSGLSNIPYHDVVHMISLLEELVKTERTSSRRVSTEMLEWLKLIRMLHTPPSLEEALKMVKMWDNRKERHSLSTFYLYVIYVAMALNYGGRRMSEVFRKEVDGLRENLRKYETTISRYQQYKSIEFLAISTATTMGCLINRDRLEAEFYKKHEENHQRFRRCTGTVTDIKDWYGILYMDGAREYPIKVFCVPQRYNLTRQHAKERVKVSFFMQFNPRHGAEAFDIAELQECPLCNCEVEVRHYDSTGDEPTIWSNKCPKCGAHCS